MLTLQMQKRKAGVQVRKLSVKEITVPQCYDALKNAQPGGPYDKALGPTEMNERWGTSLRLARTRTLPSPSANCCYQASLSPVLLT